MTKALFSLAMLQSESFWAIFLKNIKLFLHVFNVCRWNRKSCLSKMFLNLNFYVELRGKCASRRLIMNFNWKLAYLMTWPCCFRKKLNSCLHLVQNAGSASKEHTESSEYLSFLYFCPLNYNLNSSPCKVKHRLTSLSCSSDTLHWAGTRRPFLEENFRFDADLHSIHKPFNCLRSSYNTPERQYHKQSAEM